MLENCIRCGCPTPYDINTPIHLRRYFVEGSGQLCEQCFSQLYPTATASVSSVSTASVFPETTTQREQGKREDQEQIKTITLEKGRTPTTTDQDRYNQLINKTTLTDEDREELARLYKKYTV